MRYLISGEDLARLLVLAGRRVDADELGAIVSRVYEEREEAPVKLPPDVSQEPDDERFPYAKPE